MIIVILDIRQRMLAVTTISWCWGFLCCTLCRSWGRLSSLGPGSGRVSKPAPTRRCRFLRAHASSRLRLGWGPCLPQPGANCDGGGGGRSGTAPRSRRLQRPSPAASIASLSSIRPRHSTHRSAPCARSRPPAPGPWCGSRATIECIFRLDLAWRWFRNVSNAAGSSLPLHFTVNNVYDMYVILLWSQLKLPRIRVNTVAICCGKKYTFWIVTEMSFPWRVDLVFSWLSSQKAKSFSGPQTASYCEMSNREINII